MASVDDVAAAVLARLRPLDTWKLQKLVYYCQAWHLVWEGEPLFQEEIEAWANGPVVPALYQKHKGQFRVSTWPSGDPDRLSESEDSTIEAVLDHYGKMPGHVLAALTHREDPWRRARGSLPPGARGNAEITWESMASYYLSLVP